MGANSQKAFTSDKLKKFAVSGAGIGSRDRNQSAMSDNYGRTAAKTSDSSSFAEGGAAKAPSMGRAARAGGGRVSRAEGGKIRDINKVTDAGPYRYGEEPALRKKGGRVGREDGGRAAIPGDTDGRQAIPGDTDGRQAIREERARGGRTKGKGKTVVNVIVGGGEKQQPPPPPPMAATGPVPPPQPPPVPPKPPMMPPGAGGPPMAGPPGAPMGPAGAPPPGMPPMRASGGRISEKYGAGSGPGRMEKAKRENSGKVKLPA